MKAKPIEQLLDKYELSYPLARSQKRKILKSKKKTLTSILKKVVYDSPSVSAAVFFDYLLSRLGLESTPARGARAFAAAVSFAVILILTVPMGVLFNYFQLYRPMVAVSELKPYEKGTVLFSEGTVTIARGREDITKFKVQDVIATGDEITTGKDSSILFQIHKDYVRLMADSECRAELLMNTKLITLNRGGVLCRVQHVEDAEFKVLTPNAGVLVTGTVFSVNYRDDVTIVSVSRGTVQVTNHNNGQVNSVTEGKTAVIEDETQVRDSDKNESLILNLFEELDLSLNASKAGEVEFNKLHKDIQIMDREYDELISIKTLADIKKKYGMLTVIDLYNGRSYKGAIISRGTVFTLVTIEGIVKVNAKDVKNVRVLR